MSFKKTLAGQTILTVYLLPKEVQGNNTRTRQDITEEKVSSDSRCNNNNNNNNSNKL